MDTREKLILKASKECTLCNEALECAFDEAGNMNESEFAKELSQAIKIEAGVELFTQNAIKLRLHKLRGAAEVSSGNSMLDQYNKESKTSKAAKVVNEAVKLGKHVAASQGTGIDPFTKVTQNQRDEAGEVFQAAYDDTVVSILVNTELNERVMKAFAKELSQAVTIQAGVELFSAEAIRNRLRRAWGLMSSPGNSPRP